MKTALTTYAFLVGGTIHLGDAEDLGGESGDLRQWDAVCGVFYTQSVHEEDRVPNVAANDVDIARIKRAYGAAQCERCFGARR